MLTGKDNGISEVAMEKPIDALHCRLARTGIGWSQEQLAKAIGVSDRTIHGFEKGGTVARRTVIALRAVLEANGVRFVEQGDQIGVMVPRMAA